MGDGAGGLQPRGEAWDYLPHDHARSRAYRWGEDGIGGFSDTQLWCLALALWNGRDPILKERLFGLTNEEGNHGEDVKELYYYLDGPRPTPTCGCCTNTRTPPSRTRISSPRMGAGRATTSRIRARRYRHLREDRYSTSGRIRQGRPRRHPDAGHVVNRGPRLRAPVLPQLWSRNTWSWREGAARPLLRLAEEATAGDAPTGRRCGSEPLQPAEFLFCENETNAQRLFGWG